MNKLEKGFAKEVAERKDRAEIKKVKESMTRWAVDGSLSIKAQKMVNRLARFLAKKHPEIARNNPKLIGKMARMSVMAFCKTMVSPS